MYSSQLESDGRMTVKNWVDPIEVETAANSYAVLQVRGRQPYNSNEMLSLTPFEIALYLLLKLVQWIVRTHRRADYWRGGVMRRRKTRFGMSGEQLVYEEIVHGDAPSDDVMRAIAERAKSGEFEANAPLSKSLRKRMTESA